MDIAGIQSGMVGIALFDAWQAAIAPSRNSHKACGSPLLAAAAQAFEQYINVAETQMGAQITALASYALHPSGKSAHLVNSADLAPFLALNIMA